MSYNLYGKTLTPSPSLIEGESYSFMNCDTGRCIEGYFVCKNNKITVNSKEYSIVPLKNSRYKLQFNNAFLKDNDENASPIASLEEETSQINAIECCWYATKKGDNLPARIMFLGDSITRGESADILESQIWGCRPAVTQMLAMNSANRFVCVGSVKNIQSSEDETALFRHEGHGGWMAVDLYRHHGKWTEDRSIVSFLESWMIKYNPDTILIQLGTNDCAFAAARNQICEQEWDEETIQGVEDRWKSLFEIMWRVNPKINVVIATVPPTTRTQCLNNWFIEFNKRIENNVAIWKSEGKSVVFADTNSAIYNSDKTHGLCSDQIHLSPAGYHAMAAVYFKKLLELYNDKIGI